MSDPGQLRPTRIVVLGASGFIGRWVAGALSGPGASLWCPVRSPALAGPILERHRVAAAIVELDLASRADLRHLLDEVRPHLVVNLAGYGIDHQERDPTLAWAINWEVVETVVDWLARHRDPARDRLALLHAGSALEYGAVGGDLREEIEGHPTTVYGQSKLAATRAVAATMEQGAAWATVARLFTVYGPGEHAGRLLPSLLGAAGHPGRLPLSTGNQLRDFTYVGDVAEGFLRLAAGPRPRYPILNLSTGILTTVRAFVEAAAPILGIATDRLGFGELATRPEEMPHAAVSVRRLDETLGWRPVTPIPEGIRRTLAFMGRPPG